jgi:hypothetical protein
VEEDRSMRFLIGLIQHEGFTLVECTDCGPLTVLLAQYVPEVAYSHLTDVHGESGELSVIS